MSLDLKNLEKVVDLTDGSHRARCPACAEAGQDRKGEHLRISADGRFGCCVFAGDREHRKRIYALAGERGRSGIRVKVAAVANNGTVRRLRLMEQGLMVDGHAENRKQKTDTDPLPMLDRLKPRMSRTAEMESSQTSLDYSRTLRTGCLLLTREADQRMDTDIMFKELIEFQEPVRSVREHGDGSAGRLEGRPTREPIPYCTVGGDLVIPFDSPERFHWWKGGQSVSATRAELAGKEQRGRGI